VIFWVLWLIIKKGRLFQKLLFWNGPGDFLWKIHKNLPKA